jgi:hypothetical protein
MGMGQARLTPTVQGTDAHYSWGARNGLEVARHHPRLELLAQHTAAEAFGAAGFWSEMCLSPWTGGPVYAMAHLLINEP